MTKRFTFMFMAVLLSICFTTSPTAASPPPAIFIDGSQLSFDVPPVIENGRTLVPVRAIFEALGASVMWDEATQTVTAAKANTVIKLTVAQNTAYKNGTAVALSTPPIAVEGRVLVPLRFVSEALGAEVAWNEEKQAIGIKSAPPSRVDETLPMHQYSDTEVTGDEAQKDTAVQPTFPLSIKKIFSMILNHQAILIAIFLIGTGILLGALFLRRSGSRGAGKQPEIHDTTETQYQEGVSLIRQHHWADAKLALISLSIDGYEESEPLCNYAAAQEHYLESINPGAADPYWAAFMADYYCRKISDLYAGTFKDEIMEFKIVCKSNLAILENDPVAQKKHETLQEQQGNIQPVPKEAE